MSWTVLWKETCLEHILKGDMSGTYYERRHVSNILWKETCLERMKWDMFGTYERRYVWNIWKEICLEHILERRHVWNILWKETCLEHMKWDMSGTYYERRHVWNIFWNVMVIYLFRLKQWSLLKPLQLLNSIFHNMTKTVDPYKMGSNTDTVHKLYCHMWSYLWSRFKNCQ